MQHVLDNPAWHALLTGNKHLANGNDEVKYFDKEVSPFVGLKDNSAGQFNLLHNLLPHNGPIGFISTKPMQLTNGWTELQCIKCCQMVHTGVVKPADTNIKLIRLTDEHIPQMLSLTKLTNPGPFAERTIDFGHYYGVFDGDTLVAMAGQRMNPLPYAEMSAVCTHPGYLGRGYARQLLLFHINRIIRASQIPMLHVRHDNDRAIKVYESVGLETRREIYFYIIKKTDTKELRLFQE